MTAFTFCMKCRIQYVFLSTGSVPPCPYMWREEMTIGELIELLEKLPEDMQIFVAITHEGGDVKIEEVVESCKDNTVIGYMITDESTEVH